MTRMIGFGFLILAVVAGAGPAFAAGNVQNGMAIFQAKCSICHKIGPGAANALGPVLNGVVGRKSGSYPGFDYSDANKGSGITWDEATLTKYLHNPMMVVPGTKMIFPGLPADQDVADVIAYLASFGPDGQPATAAVKAPPAPRVGGD
jgi:cytochrome c